MSKDEFFAFMPLLIYGIAIGELVMHWRDYLKKDRRYWPHLVTGILLLELAFSNFYFLYDILEELFVDYLHFLARLTAPLVFLLMSSVYTPEDNRDIESYFLERMGMIFSLLALFVFLNMIMEFGFDVLTYIRASAVVFCLLVAWSKKLWIFWAFVVFRLAIFVYFQVISPL
ncbi:MAG: hypothetical protein RIC15_11845 [Vicingaceae bacterium]